MRLHWHRRDLRLTDNPALVCDSEPVVGCLIHDPAITDSVGSTRLAFYRNAVDALSADYRDRGGQLILRRGDPRQELSTLTTELGADYVSWEADYTGFATRRDRKVRTTLQRDDIEVAIRDGAVFHPPGTITTTDGTPYKVFGYYGRKWLDREKASPDDPPDEVIEPAVVTSTTFADRTDAEPQEPSLPEAGTVPATRLLEAFCDGPIFQYAVDRDRPAADATSRLSPHLSHGTVGIRTVWERTARAMERAEDEAARDSVTEFRRQLAWREFYTQVLWDRPDAITESIRDFSRPIEWRDDQAGLRAWKDGRTGFPIVDAGMRQLLADGWMHNRLRMIVASFLTKDLLVDWREGYRWFRDRLVDHDTANDVGGWQWAASTGTDAQPYFRIFNPITQGERYDPDATYIKRYVPELADVPAAVIHSWNELTTPDRDEHAPNYPAPILDHAHRRELAIEMYETAIDGK